MRGKRAIAEALFRSMIFLFLLSSCSTMESTRMQNQLNALKTQRRTISAEMQRVLDREFELWYPLSIDTVDGGFYSDINYKWQLEGTQNKFIVTQARHVWSAANASIFYQRENVLRKIAAHGSDFLKEKMWDKQFGGFFNMVNRRGEPLKENGGIVKQAYGNAFAIYGLAAYFSVSGDTSALSLAQETFRWLDQHSYDAEYGGYFQFLSGEGVPFTQGYRGAPPKDQNSTIHLLEAFTELYSVWPDPELKQRLQSLLQIVRDTITTDKGYMVLFFKRDWTPISYRDSSSEVRERNYEFDHVSFGHDIETAYLMLEAAEALGMKNDPVTLNVAKKMVDHTVAWGWDQERGGIFDGGYYFPGEIRPRIVRRTKEWWAQVEALNSLLMMSDLFPEEQQHYYDRFRAQWEYCKTYLIDGEHGGWYWGGVDIVPSNRTFPKGTIWKGNYHTSRSLINCVRRLR